MIFKVYIGLVLAIGFFLFPFRPLFADEWVEVKSENLIVYSNADPEFVQGLIEDLEIFRTYLIKLTNVNKDYIAAKKRAGAENPFLVYGLKDHISFEKLTGQNEMSGMDSIVLSFMHPRGVVTFVDFSFHPDPFEGKRGKLGRQMLFYEYAKYFLKQYSTFNYPIWYQRGLAMYLSTFELIDGVAKVGMPPLRTVRVLGSAMSHHLLPLNYLLGSTREYYSAMANRGGFVEWNLYDHNHSAFMNPDGSIDLFGYQAWGLVHYLQSKPESRQKLIEYLVKIDAGEDYKAAFEDVFGEKIKELSERVYDYTERKLFPSYEVDFLEGDFKVEVDVRELDEDESNFVKATAKSYLLGQKKRLFAFKNQLEDVSSEFRTEARTIIAEMEFFTGNIGKAEKIINEVLEQNPDFGRANGIMGAILVEKGSIAEARRYLRKSIRQNPNDLVALYYLGHSYLIDPLGNVAEGAGAMSRVFTIFPYNEKARLELAILDAMLNNLDYAVPELETLASWGSNEEIRALAQDCLTQIQKNQTCDLLETDDFKTLQAEAVRWLP